MIIIIKNDTKHTHTQNAHPRNKLHTHTQTIDLITILIL